MAGPQSLREDVLPINSDAAFGKTSRARKQSALLLHYNYGAAALKLWGRKTHILEDNAKKSRPPKPVTALSGPSKKAHNRSHAIKKREKAAKAAETSKGKRTAAWDEDDMMLFFWGNSRVATERHHKTSKAKKETLEQWRQGVVNN